MGISARFYTPATPGASSAFALAPSSVRFTPPMDPTARVRSDCPPCRRPWRTSPSPAPAAGRRPSRPARSRGVLRRHLEVNGLSSHGFSFRTRFTPDDIRCVWVNVVTRRRRTRGDAAASRDTQPSPAERTPGHGCAPLPTSPRTRRCTAVSRTSGRGRTPRASQLGLGVSGQLLVLDVLAVSERDPLRAAQGLCRPGQESGCVCHELESRRLTATRMSPANCAKPSSLGISTGHGSTHVQAWPSAGPWSATSLGSTSLCKA